MENQLIDNEFEIKEVNNKKALFYKIKYPNMNIKDEPLIKEWLNSQKLEKGNNGFLSYCHNCNLFFYLENENEEEEIKCCNYPNFGHICDYCKQIIFSDRYCCRKGALKKSITDILINGHYGLKEKNFIDCLKLLPLFFSLLFSICIFASLFFFLRFKNSFQCYGYKEKDIIFVSFGLFILIAILFSFIYFFLFSVIHLIFFIIILKGKITETK